MRGSPTRKSRVEKIRRRAERFKRFESEMGSLARAYNETNRIERVRIGQQIGAEWVAIRRGVKE